jgi:hypothetical protein
MPVHFIHVRNYSIHTYLYEIRFRMKLRLSYSICWKSNCQRRINFRNIRAVLNLKRFIVQTEYTVCTGIRYKIVPLTNLTKYWHYGTSGTENIYLHTHTHTHTHTYIYIHICINTHTHTILSPKQNSANNSQCFFLFMIFHCRYLHLYIYICIYSFIHSFSILFDDRSNASSKTVPPYSAI